MFHKLRTENLLEKKNWIDFGVQQILHILHFNRREKCFDLKIFGGAFFFLRLERSTEADGSNDFRKTKCTYFNFSSIS